jgi:hypothetical protein
VIFLTKIYACLIGNWVCLNDDPDCVMGEHMQSPCNWFEEGGDIYAPIKRDTADSYYELDYIKIHYKGKDYRINPVHIQIVVE